MDCGGQAELSQHETGVLAAESGDMGHVTGVRRQDLMMI